MLYLQDWIADGQLVDITGIYGVCLDTTTLRHWETHHNSKDDPKFEDVMYF